MSTLLKELFLYIAASKESHKCHTHLPTRAKVDASILSLQKVIGSWRTLPTHREGDLPIIHSSHHFRAYFQAHPIKVLTSHPFEENVAQTRCVLMLDQVGDRAKLVWCHLCPRSHNKGTSYNRLHSRTQSGRCLNRIRSTTGTWSGYNFLLLIIWQYTMLQSTTWS